MTEEGRKRAETIIRDRFTVAKNIICEEDNQKKTFADGYFKGWLDATLIILNAIDREDVLLPPKEKEETISETEENGPVKRLLSLFRFF